MVHARFTAVSWLIALVYRGVINDVTLWPTPTNATELQRVLGMVTSWPIHTKSVSQNRSTQILLEKDSDWQWQHEHELAWNGIKETLSKHPVLQYYDESKSLKVSSDASKDGIGAVLLEETYREWMPLAYASTSTAEKNYAQIEKEQLGVVFACERFHVYIYGRKVIVETDHQP